MFTQDNFNTAAAHIGCRPAAIRAVAEQEASGSGFFVDGKIKIKFEGHVFHHFTQGLYDQSHPALSYSAWTEKYSPATAEGEYIRFNQAYALDANAAMLATSWGAFQIMGENYSSCGYHNVGDFVAGMHKDETEQLAAFCVYIEDQGLLHYLINMAVPGQALVNAAGFSLRYNGTAYKVNHYDTNIAALFMKYNV